jgi:hypothetical protein
MPRAALASSAMFLSTIFEIPPERIAKLIRMLATDSDGEVLATIAALKRAGG